MATQYLRGDGEQVIHRDAHITDAINTSVANVAALRGAQSSHYLNGIAFYQRALDLRVETHGAASREVATCCTNLGQLHKSAGNLAVALGYFLRALYIVLALAGEKHGDAAVAVNNVAELHRHGGDFHASLQYYEWAYEIREAALGECELPVCHVAIPEDVVSVLLILLLHGLRRKCRRPSTFKFSWVALFSLAVFFVYVGDGLC